jgi:hypothetical protein
MYKLCPPNTFVVGLLKKLGLKSFTIDTEGFPYLTRIYLLHIWRKYLPGIFLHYFWRGDEDRELHNHPWSWSLSFILFGGYVEERFKDGKVVLRDVKAGRFNFIRANDYHRVHLKNKGCWSLFIAGPRKQSWGFWDVEKDTHYDHKEFFTRKLSK